MPTQQTQIIQKPLHSNAQDTVVKFTDEFADALLLQSKTLATLESTDEVQSIHVEKAKVIVLSLTQKVNRKRDLLLASGTLFLGIALQGLFGEYASQTPRAEYFLFYAVMGMIASIVFIQGYNKQ